MTFQSTNLAPQGSSVYQNHSCVRRAICIAQTQTLASAYKTLAMIPKSKIVHLTVQNTAMCRTLSGSFRSYSQSSKHYRIQKIQLRLIKLALGALRQSHFTLEDVALVFHTTTRGQRRGKRAWMCLAANGRYKIAQKQSKTRLCYHRWMS